MHRGVASSSDHGISREQLWALVLLLRTDMSKGANNHEDIIERCVVY